MILKESELKSYLDRAQGNLEMAKRIADLEHDPRHQTLDAKYSELERLSHQAKGDAQ